MAATAGLSRAAERVPATGLVLGAISSVQFGSALAKTLFDDVGPAGTVLLRVGIAAAVLVVVWRPPLTGHRPRELLVAALFGVSLAGMNLSFYEAIERIPLGVAVTFEFVGPLGVAVVASRRALDAVWVALAAAGILLLSDFGTASLDALGVALALLAGAFWAAYILLSVRVGQAFPGGSGLALAMVVAALLLLPAGAADGGLDLLDPGVLATGAAVAMLSSAIPYSLELESLRRLPAGVFGVLMSLEPGMAALAGFAILGQGLRALDLAGIALVVAASAGVSRRAEAPPPRDA